MAIYGKDITRLTLTDKAWQVYVQSDPLTITEHDDGSYSIRGIESRDGMTAEDINLWLETLADDCGLDELNKM